MSDLFACECLRCGAGFIGSWPRVFCPACRPLAAAEAEEALVKFYLDNADALMRGDRVRWRTVDDDALEQSVMDDLAEL